jgi:TolB-like protein
MNSIPQAVAHLFREAHRRKVFRTAGLYVVGAWLALQVANTLFPGFGIPDAAIRALFWAAMLGFPVALVFGWLFEIGPWGIRRTLAADAGELDAPPELARRDYLILAAFAGIVAVLAYRAVQDIRETPIEAAVSESGNAARGGERLPNSIAVLPFANISNDLENGYFCDGVAEEILQKLSDSRELTVIGRTSSFAFKDSDYGVDRISALLGVRYVLQGSVRKAGQQLRVSAQLLDQQGVQVWGQSFDRQLENVFEIQSEIAAAVAAVVAEHVLPKRVARHQPKLDAYDHYLAGRGLLHSRQVEQAVREFERAVELDPDFAEAHAELGIARILNDSGLQQARESIDRAVELEPELLRAQAARALWLGAQHPPENAEAERILRAVLARDPNMSDALNWLSGTLGDLGRADEARAVLERAARIDPLHPAIVANLAGRLHEEGETERAVELLERYIEQPRPGFMVYWELTDIYRARGRLAELNALEIRSALLSGGNLQHNGIALSYGLLGDYDSAKALLEWSLHRLPRHGGARLMLVGREAWQGHFEEVRRGLRVIYGDALAPPEEGDVIPGAFLAKAGEYAAAIAFLEPLVDADKPDGSYFAGAPGAYGLHALAWAYRHTGQEAKATQLLESAARRCEELRSAGRLQDSLVIHRCAETELLRGNRERALAGIEQAVAAGWRDYYMRIADPYWTAVQDEPRFRRLMEQVRADIARQRAVVEKDRPVEKVIAQLDAAAAERDAPTGSAPASASSPR